MHLSLGFPSRHAQFFPSPGNPRGAGVYAEVGTTGVGRNEDWTHGEVVGEQLLLRVVCTRVGNGDLDTFLGSRNPHGPIVAPMPRDSASWISGRLKERQWTNPLDLEVTIAQHSPVSSTFTCSFLLAADLGQRPLGV